jgi:hypothetical protein
MMGVFAEFERRRLSEWNQGGANGAGRQNSAHDATAGFRLRFLYGLP